MTEFLLGKISIFRYHNECNYVYISNMINLYMGEKYN